MTFFVGFKNIASSFIDKLTKQTKQASKIAGKQLQKTVQNHKAIAQQRKALDEEKMLEQNTIQNAQQFLKALKESNRQQYIKSLRAKQSIFEEISIEPIYLQANTQRQIICMEFQIGQSEFLHRLAQHHEQLSLIEQNIRTVIYGSEGRFHEVFRLTDDYIQKVNTLISKIQLFRRVLKLKQLKEFQLVAKLQKRKNCLKKRKMLLSQLQQLSKNHLLSIPKNLDQAYYSQRNRQKLYRKMEGFKGGSISIKDYIQAKLRSIAMQIKSIIQIELENWVNSHQLPAKKVEKILIMYYWMQTANIYKSNQIEISFKNINKTILCLKLQEVKNWTEFHYINDANTQSKIYILIDQLIQNHILYP